MGGRPLLGKSVSPFLRRGNILMGTAQFYSVCLRLWEGISMIAK